MDQITLQKILVTPLPRIQTVGGDVLHGIKNTDYGYDGFGEVYFSWVTAKAIKAWKRHLKMTMNVVVPVGRVKFVFSDKDLATDRNNFLAIEIGADSYSRITVPPGIWFGFQGMGDFDSLVMNVANIPHDPNEVQRLDLLDINYFWGKN